MGSNGIKTYIGNVGAVYTYGATVYPAAPAAPAPAPVVPVPVITGGNVNVYTTPWSVNIQGQNLTSTMQATVLYADGSSSQQTVVLPLAVSSDDSGGSIQLPSDPLAQSTVIVTVSDTQSGAVSGAYSMIVPAAPAPVTPVDPNIAAVTNLYETLLDREPDAGGLAYWLSLLDSGTLTLAQVQNDFVTSQEYISKHPAPPPPPPAPIATPPALPVDPNVAVVTGLYETLLDREPDPGGLAYWVNLLDSGTLTLAQVQNDFVTSQEYISKHPAPAQPEAPAYTCAGGYDCHWSPVTGTPNQQICGTNTQLFTCTAAGWQATGVNCTCN